jgi:1A family penicillin-binding protein
MNETIHLSEVAIALRYNQPLRRLLLALSILTPSLGVAQAAAPADTAAWTIVPQPQASLVYARDGSLIGEIGKEIRTSVSIRTLPKYVGQAFIAVEDHRFYQHDGVDVVGIAGALKDNIFGERRGASTITQQLVGNMHPTLIDRTDRSLGRKLDEQAAAREMERHYTKEQILEGYLNQISFGHGWYGIESAARHYFGKPAAKLTLAEAAALAAMPKGPALYDPLKYPDRVRQRRNVVLSLMADQGFITQSQEKAAQAASLVTQPNGGYSAPSPWFIDVVRIQATRAGIPVMQGGYRIYTGLDPVLQNAAVSALQEETASLEADPDYAHPKYVPPKGLTRSNKPTDYLQGLVVALDPASGDVRALVGGRDYNDSQFDRAIDGLRQPGSSFKPIVYAAAIADSIPPNAMFADTALAITLPNKTIYRPENSDSKFLGDISLRDALALSRNVVAVQVAMKLGMDSVAQVAYRMGITTPIAPYPSSAIGASVVQPLNLIAAYTTFANLGTPVEPRFIYRIEDRNRKIVFSREVRALAPALDPRVTYVVRDMMRDVVERGTAASIRRYLPRSIPAAGKTGTTNDNSDVWFVGLTPDVVAGVWLGFDKPTSIAPGAAGGSLAAPVWGKMVARYYASKPDLLTRSADQWVPPVGVIFGDFDRETGKLATDQTPADQRYTEYFVEGTEPPPLRADPWKLFSWGPVIF